MVIDDNVFARDRHLGPDRIDLVLDAVVFHDVFKPVAAVRDLGDLGAHAPLGIVHERVNVRAEGFRAVLAGEIRHALLAEVGRGDEGAEVAVVVAGRPDVGEHQPPDVVDVLAGADDLDGRNAKPLVEHFRRFAGEAGRGHASDLADVADRDREADQRVLDEDRLEEGVLGRVQAATIGVVVDQDVALFEVLDGDLLDARAQQQRHAADHRGAKVAGGDQFARRQRKPAGEVERLAEDRRVRSAHERHAHVSADGDQDASDDVQRHHVHGTAPSACRNQAAAGAPSAATSRLP